MKDGTWTVNDDARLMRKIAKDLDGVPPSAVRKLAPWIHATVDEAGRAPGLLAPLSETRAMVANSLGAGPSAQAQWDAESRSFLNGEKKVG